VIDGRAVILAASLVTPIGEGNAAAPAVISARPDISQTELANVFFCYANCGLVHLRRGYCARTIGRCSPREEVAVSHDTIKRHFKLLKAPYKRRAKADSIIDSAKKLARLILSSDELLHEHRRKMLKEVLWFVTEANGKYSTRYRSAEVVRLARDEPESEVPVRHEHVYPRAVVADEILSRQDELRQHPGLLDELLDQSVGCIVTVYEHGELLSGRTGWGRYEHVPVLDMSEIPPKLLKV
jgi:hypothetical protein